MNYQSKGLQYSLLIHAVIFLLIAYTGTGISESELSTPVTIDFGIIKEPEPLPEPEPVPVFPVQEKITEEKPVQTFVPPPQTKAEHIQKKEKVLPVRREKIKGTREKAKKIVIAEKKEPPRIKQVIEEKKEEPPKLKEEPPKVTEEPQHIIQADEKKEEAPSVQANENFTAQKNESVPDSPPSDTDKTPPAESFSENSAALAATSSVSSGNASSSEGSNTKGSTVAGYSKSGYGSGGSGSYGSGEYSDNLTFGSGAGPKYRHREMPVYPSLARRLGKEGKVLLRLTIDENGNLVNVEVIEDSGYGFADAAIAAVKKSTFIPPIFNGRTIRAKALLPVKFTLR